jgi:hypothetical protein
MASSTSSLFVNKNGGITPPSFFFMIGAPLLLSGRLLLGGAAIVFGMILALRASMEELKEEDKQEIRYNILDAVDLIEELTALEESQQDDHKARSKCLACLSALARKSNKKNGQNDLPLISQQAAYITLRMYPEDDEAIEGALSLLALVSKDPEVRRRNKYQADEYGLDQPIAAMRKALERAKVEESEEKEEKLAEIQRKGCLFLGVLADGDQDFDLAIKIVVEEDGLEAILDAANWFRHHDTVINWALWAIFILCYDNLQNKIHLVRHGGIGTVCQSLSNNPQTLEVNRHGIAILFDLLREEQESNGLKFDSWEARRLALAAGLHKVVKNAMMEFSDSRDIMMMGQEMLIGTGYSGEIPLYQQM